MRHRLALRRYNVAMTPTAAEQRLYALWGEIHDLISIEGLLEWDQETFMPPRGQIARGQALATVAGIKHQRLTDPELLATLETCAELAEEGSVLAAQVRCARYDVDRATRLPEELVRALATAKSTGLAAWHEARSQADFTLFEKPLAEIIHLSRDMAAAIRPDGAAYDALLDSNEPGMTEAELAPLFSELRAALTPLVRGAIESGAVVDESPAFGSFDIDAQIAFGQNAAQAIGFDFSAGRLDSSGHPFCIGIARDDVRMTSRGQEDDFRPAFFGILHESGHGLYEQGQPRDYLRTPVGRAISVGIHESQSRLWENHVGRSRGFWRWALPNFHAAFPGSRDVTLEQLWPALHTIKPSLIRTEADEATYNLHIIARFELERALFSGDLEVADLPDAWDALYDELLGIRAPTVADGVLQDIHWSQGMFGYFPTYTLGTMIAAQLFAAAERQLGDQEEAFARGEFRPLLGWLRDLIHRQGGLFTSRELVLRATGKPLSSADLLSYLETTCQEALASSRSRAANR